MVDFPARPFLGQTRGSLFCLRQPHKYGAVCATSREGRENQCRLKCEHSGRRQNAEQHLKIAFPNRHRVRTADQIMCSEAPNRDKFGHRRIGARLAPSAQRQRQAPSHPAPSDPLAPSPPLVPEQVTRQVICYLCATLLVLYVDFISRLI